MKFYVIEFLGFFVSKYIFIIKNFVNKILKLKIVL